MLVPNLLLIYVKPPFDYPPVFECVSEGKGGDDGDDDEDDDGIMMLPLIHEGTLLTSYLFC